jgi:hypothetical protein
MKIVPRPALAAACCLALAAPAAAIPPNPPIALPPHTAPDASDSQSTEMKAELQRAKDAINTAKKPEDLDPIVFALQKYENNGFGGGVVQPAGPGDQELLQQLIGALEFTKQWQNYLSHIAAGEPDQARSDLQMISQNTNGMILIPRSRLLALLDGRQALALPGNVPAAPAEVPDAQKIIDGISTLDDLPTALGKLNDLAAQQDNLARDYAQHLAPMVEVYEDLKNGLPTSVSIDFMGGLSGAGVSVKANSLLLKFILQHYFDTYKGAPPADAETPAAYATRVKNDALAGQDWGLLKKAVSVHAFLYRDVANGMTTDDATAGIDQMIAGLNQDEAGQYALAVESLLNALKAGSLEIPARFIGQKLDAIKRDHPAEYDQGVESYLAPLPPQYPFMPGMNPALFNPAFRGARHWPRLPNPLDPALSFPATKPAPTTTNAAPSAAALPSTNAPAAN